MHAGETTMKTILSLIAAFASVMIPAAAQNYPSKPVRAIVPFAAGGG